MDSVNVNSAVAERPSGSPESDGLLRMDKVTAHYPGGGQALKDVTFCVRPGSIVGLLGANGSGKTTTLRAISGVLPTTGTLLYAGVPLVGGPAARATVGIAHVPEGRKIYAGLTVRENLQLGIFGRTRGAPGGALDDLDRVLEIFPELEKHMNRSGAWLSGGEQQMVAIGRAIMARPRLMLLDEPTMGLAPIIVERLAEVLKKAASPDLTLLIAEENIQFATTVSDECCVLQTGRIVWSGAAAELRNDSEIQSMLLR